MRPALRGFFITSNLVTMLEIILSSIWVLCVLFAGVATYAHLDTASRLGRLWANKLSVMDSITIFVSILFAYATVFIFLYPDVQISWIRVFYSIGSSGPTICAQGGKCYFDILLGQTT